MGARIPTGITIDLRGPEGNIFYILGLCKKLARDYLEQWEEEIFNKETRLDGTRDYDQILDACRQWFGLIYIGQ